MVLLRTSVHGILRRFTPQNDRIFLVLPKTSTVILSAAKDPVRLGLVVLFTGFFAFGSE